MNNNICFLCLDIGELVLDPVATKVLKIHFKFSLKNSIYKLFLLSLEEADTDLETDRLLGQQRTDDTGFFDEKTVSF